MDDKQPYGREERPPEGPPEGTLPDPSPPPEHYQSSYGRPTTEDLIQRSYPKGRVGLERFLKGDKLVMSIAFGLFLMFLGAIIIGAVSISAGPQTTDEKYDDDDNGYIDGDKIDNYNRDLEDYQNGRDFGVLLGTIIVNFGILILVVALLGGALINKDMEKFVRFGMVIIAGLILMWSGLL